MALILRPDLPYHRPSFTQRSFAPEAFCCSSIFAPMTSAAVLASTTRLPLLVIRMALPYECVLAGHENIPVSLTGPCQRAMLFDSGEPDGCTYPVLPHR